MLKMPTWRSTSSFENCPEISLRELTSRSVAESARMVARDRRVRSRDTGSGKEGKYTSHLESMCTKESSAGDAGMCLRRNLTASTPELIIVTAIGSIKL